MNKFFELEYIGISIPVIKKIETLLPFDIYLKRSEEAFTKVFNRGSEIDIDRLDRYWKKKKVNALFVGKDNYREYLMVVSKVAENFFNKEEEFNVEEIISVSEEMINMTMLEVFVDMHVDQDAVSHAATAIKGCLKAISRDPKSMISLFQRIAKHPYLMKHSITTSMFAIIISKQAKLSSQKTLFNIGLGSMLHDIGLSNLPCGTEEKDQINLSASEWKELKEHPHLGKRMLDNLKGIPNEVSMIVLQHHEQPNGRGYPNGLYDKKIFSLAKIVAIADSFSSLITKTTHKDALPPLKALETMKLDQGKFDPKYLKLFIDFIIPVK
jgi:HD-GYP domain-containing protein (c-di-GMP phosphodiesterase class II)